MRVIFAYCLLLLHSYALAEMVDHRMNGSFFDVEHEGEGFIVEITGESTALIYWFTYDDAGNQRWFIGTGDVSENQIFVQELLAGSGARFGDGFVPTDVLLTPVGNLNLEWSDCDTCLLYTSPSPRD